MKLKRPSPAMVVAVLALVMSTTGGAIAAVNYAKNSDAVDGYSAVKAAKAGSGKAAGKLVATYRGGDNRGKLPLRIIAGAASKKSVDRLSDAAALGANGARLIPVTDNQTTASDSMIDLGLGELQVSCTDQNDQGGIENAATRINITNDSGTPFNLAREVGNGAATIVALNSGVVETFTIPQQNTFRIQLQGGSTTVLVDGTAQQVGQGTNDSSCAVWATAIVVD